MWCIIKLMNSNGKTRTSFFR